MNPVSTYLIRNPDVQKIQDFFISFLGWKRKQWNDAKSGSKNRKWCKSNCSLVHFGYFNHLLQYLWYFHNHSFWRVLKLSTWLMSHTLSYFFCGIHNFSVIISTVMSTFPPIKILTLDMCTLYSYNLTLVSQPLKHENFLSNIHFAIYWSPKFKSKLWSNLWKLQKLELRWNPLSFFCHKSGQNFILYWIRQKS